MSGTPSVLQYEEVVNELCRYINIGIDGNIVRKNVDRNDVNKKEWNGNLVNTGGDDETYVDVLTPYTFLRIPNECSTLTITWPYYQILQMRLRFSLGGKRPNIYTKTLEARNKLIYLKIRFQIQVFTFHLKLKKYSHRVFIHMLGGADAPV